MTITNVDQVAICSKSLFFSIGTRFQPTPKYTDATAEGGVVVCIEGFNMHKSIIIGISVKWVLYMHQTFH